MEIIKRLFNIIRSHFYYVKDVEEPYAPYYPSGTEIANKRIELLLSIGAVFIYRNIEMSVIRNHIAQKFLASPWGISPWNEDCYVVAEYIVNGVCVQKKFDKREILNLKFKE